MSDVLYPAYPSYRGLAFSVQRSPEFSTIIQRSSNGVETRVLLMQNPRWHWVLNYNYLKDMPADLPADFTYTDLRTLWDFMLARKGRYDTFLLHDPDDDYVGPALNDDDSPNTDAQLQLVQDVITGAWYSPIQRRMGGQFWEDLFDIYDDLKVYANGVLQEIDTDYVIGGPGLAITGYSFSGLYLAWASEPADPVTAEFHFLWRVRFEMDRQDFDKFMPNLWAIGGDLGAKGEGTVKLISAKNGLPGDIHITPYPTPPPAATEIETYIYLLSCGCCDDTMQCYTDIEDENGPLCDATFISTFRPLDTTDFGGTCAYSFEAVWKNKSEQNTGYIYLVDSEENVIATIECPPNSQGPIGNTSAGGESRADGYYGTNLYRSNVPFTPTEGSHQYGLRVAIQSGYLPGWDGTASILKVTEAKIVVRQSAGPTASVVHIPLMTDVDCSLSWDTHPLGYACITSGRESVFAEMAEPGDYDANNRPDEELYDQIRDIWKYEASMLKNLDHVVFDAALGYFTSYISPRSKELFGVPNFSWCRYQVRWCPVSTGSPVQLSGTHTTDVVTDASLNEYTLISGSDFTWSQLHDGHSWGATLELDLADMNSAIGNYLYVSGNEDVYGGDTDDGTYHSWGRLGLTKFSPPGGSTITRAWLEVLVSINPVREDDTCKILFKYEVDQEVNHGYAILYDLTADGPVAGSELEWDTYTMWERKSVTLDKSLFVDGHEYQMKWRRSDEIPDESLANPYFSDANLWLYVTELEEFSSWNRVVQCNQHMFTYEMFVYEDWGVYSPLLYYTRGGNIYIMSRPKLYLPEGAEAYYEQCAMMWTWYPLFYDHSYDVWERESLYDVGLTDDMIDAPSSSEVLASAVYMAADWDVFDGYVHRFRTANIAEDLVDGHRYASCQPFADEEAGDRPLAGYIITHYALGA
jgi:hypothetical protein